MIDNQEGFLDRTYIKQLYTINGIKFSQREIDIMACLLNGRTPKGIASFLSISPRTIETHIRSIMLKSDCHSREGIINFIEKTPQASLLRKHYFNLVSDVTFKQKLLEIAKLRPQSSPLIYLIFKQESTASLVLAQELEKHLKLAGIACSLIYYKKGNPFSSLISPDDSHLNKHFLIIDPHDWLISPEAPLPEENSLLSFINHLTEKAEHILFLALTNATDLSLPIEGEKIISINFIDQQKYYDSVFEILRKTITHPKLEPLICQINEQYISAANDYPPAVDSSKTEEKPPLVDNKLPKYRLKKFHKTCLGIAAFISIIIGIIWAEKKGLQAAFLSSTQAVRSDLFIPTEATLLCRPELLLQIEKSLNKKQAIQVVALIGVGGAGKTTLARQYARKQQVSVTWEINAESKENLINSFERLAHALAKTNTERKYLQEIEEIKRVSEREQKLFSFIKERLRAYPNWILIYNDVNNFPQIQNYVPHDQTIWGKGKVILTTRDSNISNNGYIDNTIQIGELTLNEKLGLFIKIMKNKDLNQFISHQKEQAQIFLSKLPSFPLDISIAAYYLKSTQVSYEKYLEYLKNYDTEFASTQENILKGANNYSRSRYSIIALSLKSLIETNKDFEELLLFISLLNTQDIPKPLLDAHKGEVVVDNFIYNLKKYSLLTDSSSNSQYSFPTLSAHKSTQEISLIYLIKTLHLNKNPHSLQAISTTLEKYIETIISEEDFSKMKLLASHSEVFLSHSIGIDNNLRAALKGKLGIIYFYLGDYNKSHKILEESLTNLDRIAPENQFRLAHILTHLGMVYRKFGNYEKAKNLLETSIQLYRTHSPQRKIEIAQSLRYLGMIHKSLGNYEKAKELFKESLLIHKTHFSENHRGFAWSLGSLGSVYRKLGQYEKARDLLEQSLAVYKKNFPKNHGGLAWTLAHLGRVYISMGNYEKAKDLFEQSLLIYRTHLSKNNVRISWVLAPLGIVYRELGNYEKAKDLLEQSLAIYSSNLAEGHIAMAWTTVHLATVYKGLGDYEKARSLLNKGLVDYEKHYGKEHRENARILMELGKLCFLEGKLKSAEELIHKSLTIFSQNQHPEAYVALEYLADIYLKKSSYALSDGNIEQSVTFKEQAKTYLEQASNIVKKYFPPNSPHLKRIQHKMDRIV
ncbi:MAG: tetratricopeptide repeat protein [Candidatus Paracaedibacteraceae bacterium]|nr:tetratricopeptide repeat protein [Candidatus Paracaedibacteraceae bacterium]